MATPTNTKHQKSMAFMQHLEELRKRLFYCSIMLLISAMLCWNWAPLFFNYLLLPLQKVTTAPLIVLTPLEMFVTYLKLAILIGSLITAPFALLQLWLFVAPGLHRHERRFILPFIILGSILFIGGAAFAFYGVMPIGFDYLQTLLPSTVQATYSVESYMSLVVQMMWAFGLVFELPLLIVILCRSGIVSVEQLASFRKYWLVIAVTIAAILTPPDPISQIMMSIPLIVFFEVGILLAKFMARKAAIATQQ